MFDMSEPVALEEGLDRMAAWARQVGMRASQDFGEIEVTKGLPPSWLES